MGAGMERVACLVGSLALFLKGEKRGSGVVSIGWAKINTWLILLFACELCCWFLMSLSHHQNHIPSSNRATVQSGLKDTSRRGDFFT